MVARSGRQHRALVVALLATLLLWHVPFGGFVLYPFKLLATWMHELSHGIAMLVTGAGFDRMEVYRDTSGYAYSLRSTGPLGAALVASAGYTGTAAIGAVLLVVGAGDRGARVALAAIGAALLASAALWVRNPFGIAATVGLGVALLGVAVFARAGATSLLLNFVAAQACVNAVLDIRVLFRSNLVVNGEVVQRSDAHTMADAAFGPAWLWAVAWLAWSLALFYVALRYSYRTSSRSDHGSAST
ncbi:MAG: M50 family peptidase [Deltaproteobacteria bacterium]|nr:MAG: M50 family peptidase [Deltaproteobacteria bacterium]